MIRKAIIILLSFGTGATLLLGLLTWREVLPSTQARAYDARPPLYLVKYSKIPTQWSYGFARGCLWIGIIKEVEPRRFPIYEYVKFWTTDYRVFVVDTSIEATLPYYEKGGQRFPYYEFTFLGLFTKGRKWTYIQSSILRVRPLALFALLATYPTITFIRGPLRRYRLRKRGWPLSKPWRVVKWMGVCSSLVTGVLWFESNVRTYSYFYHKASSTNGRMVSLGLGSGQLCLEMLLYELPSESHFKDIPTGHFINGFPSGTISSTMFNGTGVFVPLAPTFVLLFVGTCVLIYLDRRYPKGNCQNCGYDLTGNVSGVCSECGKPI